MEGDQLEADRLSLATLFGHATCLSADDMRAEPDLPLTTIGGIDTCMVSMGPMIVGVIDGYQLTQECLQEAFLRLCPSLRVVAFSTVDQCIEAARSDIEILIYSSHAGSDAAATTIGDIALLRQAFATLPLVVMSDAEDAQQAATIWNTLKSGAQGFIPTRRSGIRITLEALRFIKAGGTYAPLECLLADQAIPAAPAAEPPPKARLTSRQQDVLVHLQQGKANKTIAHELGMSESTVKIHIRNIMRSMGATNRTQAAFRAQSR